MSELYLVLRHRLRSVAEWVELGSKEMRAARRSQGLSLEAVARAMHVSAKTYERYEKQGRVPRHTLGTYAGIVDLEIEAPAKVRLTVPEGKAVATLTQAAEAVSVAVRDLRQVTQALQQLREDVLPARKARQPARRSR